MQPVNGDAATMRDTLRARARALAVPLLEEADEADAGALLALVVRVGEEWMGIPLDDIASVGRPGRVTPLPRAQLPVYGVAAWRGRPLTVLVLGAGAPPEGEERRFVVLGDGRRAAVAVLVDAVDDVRSIRRDALAALGPAAATRRVPDLGVTPDGVTIVDAAALLRGET